MAESAALHTKFTNLWPEAALLKSFARNEVLIDADSSVAVDMMDDRDRNRLRSKNRT